ncbi:hypothetical protein FRC18_006128 [Serendipita sp. 400]|nr:hypothetical protein FRC18_006128 [Serendipita sp. 400]
MDVATLSIMAPTVLLPPMRKTVLLSTTTVAEFVSKLAQIYIPDVLGTQPSVGPLHEEDDNALSTTYDWADLSISNDSHELESPVEYPNVTLEHADIPPKIVLSDADRERLLSDEFERSYALRWLTGLIAHADEWIRRGEENGDNDKDVDQLQKQREGVIERASALLAACSGPSASGAVTRTFVFPLKIKSPAQSTTASPHTVQVLLKDDSLLSQDHTAVGLQTWGSAPILAHLLAHSPQRFGLWPTPEEKSELRILELGAGTGLLSILSWRLLQHQALSGQQPRQCLVLATDFHDSVLSNLESNIDLNRAHSQSVVPTVCIETRHLDWADCPNFSNQERFDVVLGADIIYEREHAQLIKVVVERTLKLPTRSNPSGGVFWLMYPLRHTHSVEIRMTEEVFGTVLEDTAFPTNEELVTWRLGVVEIQSLERRKGIGKGDDVSYRLLKIKWVKTS